MPIYNRSRVSCMRLASLEFLSCGSLSPGLRKYWLSKFEMMLPNNASTGWRVKTHACFSQGKLAKSGSVTTAVVSGKNHFARGL